MTRTAAVVVTHNSQRWIEATLRTVIEQTTPADAIVIIDDASVDDTVAIVRRLLGGEADVRSAESTDPVRVTRIAQNFEQGVRACADFELVVLGDHDDLWHADRIAHQASLLEQQPAMAMVASDGRLVDIEGRAVGGTLRSVFPVAEGFNSMPPPDQMRETLRHSIATGGASALRPALFADLTVPPGWLHDRWWSLVATAMEAMLVDESVVIDYRISDEQEVGLQRGSQESAGVARLSQLKASNGAGPLRKFRDVSTHLTRVSTPATRTELSTRRLVRNLLGKG
jgi:glycosyltransferase involved in cell wall biosynthesis